MFHRNAPLHSPRMERQPQHHAEASSTAGERESGTYAVAVVVDGVGQAENLSQHPNARETRKEKEAKTTTQYHARYTNGK